MVLFCDVHNLFMDIYYVNVMYSIIINYIINLIQFVYIYHKYFNNNINEKKYLYKYYNRKMDFLTDIAQAV